MSGFQLLALGFDPMATLSIHTPWRQTLPHDPELEQLTLLAARMLGAPCGLLLLADPRGDWLLASSGIQPGAPRLLEGGRLAERTAALGRGLWLEDLAREADFADHPLLAREPPLHAYAGAPLVSADGIWLGALAVMDGAPRALGPDRGELLGMLARQAAARLELLGRVRHLEEAERALRDSEERFRMLAENAVDVLYRVSLAPEMRFDFLGPSVAGVLGYLPEEFYADPSLALRLVHPEDRHFLEPQALEADLLPATLRWIRADGGLVYTEHRGRVVRDGAGRPIAVEGVARDITARRRADEQQWQAHALLQAVVEGSSDAIFVKDLEGRYLLINPVGAALLGRQVQEVLGKRDQDLFSEESADDIIERDRDIMASGRPRSYEGESTAAGVRHTWLSTKTPFRNRDGKVVGLVGVSRDITVQKLHELDQARKLRDLQERLAGREALLASAGELMSGAVHALEDAAVPQGSGDASEALRVLRAVQGDLDAICGVGAGALGHGQVKRPPEQGAPGGTA